MRGELNALEKHVFTLNEQNKELFSELDNFARADEMVKSQLDRRGRVMDLKDAMQSDLLKSQKMLESRSPQGRHDY